MHAIGTIRPRFGALHTQRNQIRWIPDDPFGVQHARGEILIVTRRAHQQAERGRRRRFVRRVGLGQPQLEGRLDGDEVLIRDSGGAQ